MIQDLIKEVLLVEEDMRAILNEAQEFAKAIRSNAEAQAQVLPRESRERAESEAQRKIQEARQRSDQLRQATLDEARAQAESFRQKALANVPRAVDYVLAQVTRTVEA
jgi:V/A-type H+-transporting ATPase subunit G/H